MNRINAFQASPEAMQLLVNVEEYLRECGLKYSLYELVKMRASQINGCAYCLDMHSKDARKAGETEQRLYLLSAWRESSLFSARERAALAWTEAVTLIADHHVSETLYKDVTEHFSDKELADLTTLVCQINTWNRLAISFQYQHSVA